MSLRSATVLGLAALLLAAPAARAQATFDFESGPAGPTPYTLTSGGVSATFGNPGAPYYEILGPFGPGAFTLLSGNVLGTFPGTGDVVGAQPLGIAFSTPLSSIALDFALWSPLGGTRLTLDAFLGATPVGSVTTVAGAGAGSPEGAASFGGGPFDRVVLSSDANDFAIDDLVATVATVPEPAPLALLLGAGSGLLGAALRRRRAAR